jgi:hypothetical protein
MISDYSEINPGIECKKYLHFFCIERSLTQKVYPVVEFDSQLEAFS